MTNKRPQQGFTELYRMMKNEIIQELGGQCKQCPQTNPDLLCLTVKPGTWAGLGITNKLDRMNWMGANLSQVVLVCVDHLQTYTARNPAARSHRDQVIDAYGGKCVGCGATENLGVTTGRGIPLPRWPGGRKYNSSQKCAMLVREGFPKGWVLVCMPCCQKGVHLLTPVSD